MNSTASTLGLRRSLLLLLFVLSSFSASTLHAQARVDQYIQEAATKSFEYVFSSYLGGGDNIVRSLVMPFDFTYDGTEYAAGTRLYVSHNGWLKFGSSSSGYNTVGNSSYPGHIAVFAADQYSSIYYGVSGSSPNRILTVMYYSLRPYGYYSYYKYINVRFFEGSNAIEFNYSSHNYYHPRSSGIGLNGNSTGGFRSKVYSYGTYYSPSQDIRYRPPVSDKPELTVTAPDVMDFGLMPLGETQTLCFTVTNTGEAGEAGAPANPLVFSPASIIGPSDFTLVSEPTASLNIGESAEYCISFSPSAPGVMNASIAVKTNAAESGTETVMLTGTGVAPVMAVEQKFLFRKTHTKAGFERDQSFPIMNEGNAPLTITSVVLAGEYPDQYEITSIPDAPIPPGEEGWVSVMHKPFMEGLTDAELHITSNGFNSETHRVDLWGTGILPRLAVSTSSAGSDSVRIGDTTYYTVTLENVGSDTLIVMQDYFGYADPDFFYAGLYGADSIIQPGQSREVTVGFAPQTRGVRQARLRLTTNIPLTFETPARDTSEFSIDFIHVGVPSGLLYAEGPVMDTGLVGAELCNTVTIYNNGEEALTVTEASLSGANASEFTLTGVGFTFPVTIPAMGSVEAQLCATPADRGERLATINVVANSNGETFTQELSVSVLAQLACATPDVTAAFNEQIVRIGTTESAMVTVTNCGDIAATYNAVIAGDGYTLVSPAMSDVIAAGGTHTYEVSFMPAAMAAAPGTLTITSPNVADMVIELAGTGGMAVLAASSTSAGSIAVGNSIDFDVTVSNTGNLAWTGIDATIDGGDFTLKSAPSTIDANGSGTFTFTFTPSLEGARTATVSFPTSDANTFNFALSGEGLTAAGVRPVAEGGYVLGQSYPNPAVREASISFVMNEPGRAMIQLTDVTGKTVATLADGYFTRGENTIRFTLPELASGTYFYEMIAGNTRLQRTLQIRK